MINRTRTILALGVLLALNFSCKDGERNDREEVDIMAQEDPEGPVELDDPPNQDPDNTITAAVEDEQELNRFHEVFGENTQDEIPGEPGKKTVFAFNNAAYEGLNDQQKNQLNPEQSKRIMNLLKYYTIEEEVRLKDLKKRIKEGGGSYTINTSLGEPITASLEDGAVVLQDGQENKARIVAADMEASDGVVHVVDRLLFPINEALGKDPTSRDFEKDSEAGDNQ